MATNFFQRWSSRTLTAKDNAQTELQENNETAVELAEPEQIVELSSEQANKLTTELNQTVTPDELASDVADDNTNEALTIADADRVTFDSGVASFLQRGVDKSVKKAALKKLFHSDEFNYISDMDDHTEDFSNIPKLDDSVAKQLRGWVNAVLDDTDQEAELVQKTELVEEPEAKLIQEPAMPVVEDETAEPVMEDLASSQCVDESNSKNHQQGET